MSERAHQRTRVAGLPEGDVIRILVEQHARIRALFHAVSSARDAMTKADAFDDLRALFALHETAEEMFLRPVTSKMGADDVADARNQEEAEANQVLAGLEKLDVTTSDFDAQLTDFQSSVEEHARAEEREEFPRVLEAVDAGTRQDMGRMLAAAEKASPTHPDPSAAGSTAAQWTAGPFASLIDHAKDALQKAAS